MYDTREEATQKLASSIILFNDSPVYIQEATGRGSKIHLKYVHLRSGNERSNDLNEPGWNYRNLGDRLGYFNSDLTIHGVGTYREACYSRRVAVRQSHSTQGLSHRNVRISDFRGSRKLALSRSGVGFQSVYNQPWFLDMLEKKYPSFSDVKSLFSSDKYTTSKAFSRQFAIYRPDDGPFSLEYRGYEIGKSDDLHRFKIHPDRNYLNETLEYLDIKVS